MTFRVTDKQSEHTLRYTRLLRELDMKRRGFEYTQNAARDDWCTAPEALEPVYRFGAIGLDPMTNPHSLVKAREHWFKPGLHSERRLIHQPAVTNIHEVDALWVEWTGFGLVYVNYLYGRETNQRYAHKIAREGRNGAEIIALGTASPGARWFQRHFARATALCFWEGRLQFVGAPEVADFESVFVYFGDRPTRFERIFSRHGWCVRGRPNLRAEFPLLRRRFNSQLWEEGEHEQALGRRLGGIRCVL